MPPHHPILFETRTILAATIVAAFVGSAVAPSVGAAGETLPIWREVFKRPEVAPSTIPASVENPLTPPKIRLGRSLFFDARLSGAQDRSCATCHNPERAFTDGRPRAAALDDTTLLPNTPPLLNLAWSKRLFWDGRVRTLEDQARHPIEHPQEMAGNWSAIIRRLAADPRFVESFREAFPASPAPGPDTIAAALASYERTIISAPSRFDRFIAGDERALSSEEKSGFRLFVGKAGCVGCHNGWRFTDDRLHLTGRSSNPLRTPTLRGLSLSAPYMHDGSLATLSDVIGYYETLERNDPALSPNLVRPLKLTIKEERALNAFLRAIE
jgi:cytochrome c peroxidase